MVVKQKPAPAVVKAAAKSLAKTPNSAKAKPTMDQSMKARILDDQKNAPQPHKPTKKGK